MEITKQDKRLIDEAKRVSREFRRAKWKGHRISGVGAALRVKDNKMFSGPNIDHPDSAPCSMCAEYSALSKAFSEGYTKIETIVAYSDGRIMFPCGRCMEFLRLFGDPYIIVSEGKRGTKLRLSAIHRFQNK